MSRWIERSASVFGLLVLGLAATACYSETGSTLPEETPAPPIVLTGGLYIQGGETQDVKLTVQPEGVTETQTTGVMVIDNYRGSAEFTINRSDSKNLVLSGYTTRCIYQRECYYDGYHRRFLNVGLQVTESGIVGATPTANDSLIWNVVRVVKDGDSKIGFEGTVSSLGGPINVSLAISADGTIEGRVAYQSRTMILNGFVDPAQRALGVPAEAAGALLLVSAVHAQIKVDLDL